MPKLALVKKVGVPVPANMPADVTHLVAYYGPKGFTPSYDQTTNRLAVALATIPKQTVNGVEYFVFDPVAANLPASPADTELDFYFTLTDITDKEEGDFNPVLTVPLDRTPPPKLGAAVLLG